MTACMHDRTLPTIVIIDAEQRDLDLLCRLLAREALGDVRVFSDPGWGLAYCLENAPDLIIVAHRVARLDGFDGLDGITLIERLRCYPATCDIPMLMTSPCGEREIRHAALDAGVSDFLTQPIDDRELICRARNLLRMRARAKCNANRSEHLEDEVRKVTAKILLREQELLFRISRAAEYRDPETGGHIQRMAHYSRLIAQQMGFSPSDQAMIFAAAPMHDVGKIAIPDSILLKPGKLSDDEYEFMKRHAQFGYDLLAESDAPVLQMGAVIARSHHEKFDGTGYPQGLSGQEIPVFGRIAAVADVFDALTNTRPYKKAWSLDAAREFLQLGSGSQFDPACIACFLSVWDDIQSIHWKFKDADICCTDGVASGEVRRPPWSMQPRRPDGRLPVSA